MQVLLLVLPGNAKASQVDAGGLSSLAVLRLMGLPTLQVLVQGEPGASLKERSAAKKRAQAAVASQVHPHSSCNVMSSNTTWWYMYCCLLVAPGSSLCCATCIALQQHDGVLVANASSIRSWHSFLAPYASAQVCQLIVCVVSARK